MIAVRFLGYDEGNQTLGLYDTAGPSGWKISLSEVPLARDLQRVGGGRALVGFDRGYFEVDLANGSRLKVVDRWTGVTSVRRLENGHTLIAGVDLDGPGIAVLTLDTDDRVVNAATRPGSYLRLLRTTPEGTWLLGADEKFLETDSCLTEIRQLRAPGFRHAWMAHRATDGSTLVSAGYGAFMARFDPTGRLAGTFGGVDSVPSEVSPYFYASFEPLADGLLVVNWQGHGPDNASKGRQLVHFTVDGRYLDSWSSSEISSLQGILLLD